MPTFKKPQRINYAPFRTCLFDFIQNGVDAFDGPQSLYKFIVVVQLSDEKCSSCLCFLNRLSRCFRFLGLPDYVVGNLFRAVNVVLEHFGIVVPSVDVVCSLLVDFMYVLLQHVVNLLISLELVHVERENTKSPKNHTSSFALALSSALIAADSPSGLILSEDIVSSGNAFSVVKRTSAGPSPLESGVVPAVRSVAIKTCDRMGCAFVTLLKTLRNFETLCLL